jgi:hypothetical protein
MTSSPTPVAASEIVSPCQWKGLCADSEEKRSPVSDINAVEVDSQSKEGA